MKTIEKAVIMSALALLAGCSQNDDFTDGGDPVAVNFTAGIEGAGPTAYSASGGTRTNAPGTRTTGGGDMWTADDEIGIFMLAADDLTAPGGSLAAAGDVLADNVAYNAVPGSPASGATFVPVNEDDTIYYPQSGTVDFAAYYPHGATGDTYIYKVSVAGQTSEAAQNALDVLYAKTTGVAKSQTAVALAFGHVLSKITLNVTLGAGFSGGDVTAVVFSGMPRTATLDLRDGSLTAGAAGDFDALKTATSTFTALLVPQPTGGSGRTAVFTVDGAPYTWTIPGTEDFAAGNHYVYPVTVNETGITVGTPMITPWRTRDNGTAAAEKLDVVKIKAGTFQMGSPDSDSDASSDEKPQHWVKLTQDFYMSKYEVTFAQYDAFCDDTDRSRPSDTWGRGDRPVINVSWYDAVAYCEWLSQTTGLSWTLPTEAQWEYACRAGTTTAYSYGSSADGNYMWFNGNSSTTHEVGTKKANPWGLYDMHGNVFEWCLDQWDASNNYPVAATEDAAIENPLVVTGDLRVLRGGSWIFNAQGCRSAYRDYTDPDYASNIVGFRVVFVP